MDFSAQYSSRAKAENFTVIDAGFAIYDVLWVLAIALNNTMTMVNSNDIGQTNCENVPGSLMSLEHFDHTNKRMGCVIRWNLNNTNFMGVSVSDFDFGLLDFIMHWNNVYRAILYMMSIEHESMIVFSYINTLSMVKCHTYLSNVN